MARKQNPGADCELIPIHNPTDTTLPSKARSFRQRVFRGRPRVHDSTTSLIHQQ